MSKYILITASPRRGANSDSIAEFIKDALGNNDVEIWNIYEKDFTYCHADNACNEKDHCVIEDDAKTLVDDLKKADGAFLISPIYFGRLPGPACTLIDRFYGVFNPAKGLDVPSPDKKLGIVFTMGGDEEAVKNAEPVAAQTAFAFTVVGFGASESVILGDNNVSDAFVTNENEQSKVKTLVDWMI